MCAYLGNQCQIQIFRTCCESLSTIFHEDVETFVQIKKVLEIELMAPVCFADVMIIIIVMEIIIINEVQDHCYHGFKANLQV